MQGPATPGELRTGKGDIDGGVVAADDSVGEALLAQPSIGRIRAEADSRHQSARHIVVRRHATCRANLAQYSVTGDVVTKNSTMSENNTHIGRLIPMLYRQRM